MGTTRLTPAQKRTILAARDTHGFVIFRSLGGRRRRAMLDRMEMAGLVVPGTNQVTSQALRAADRAWLDMLHSEAQTLNYWIKHPHTYAEHLKFDTAPIQREALVVSGEVERAHAEALIENTLRRPHMVRAIAIGAAERARAAGTACFHPRSCPGCDSRGDACGAHRKGDAGHESCSGTAPEPGNAPPHCPAGEACTGRAFPGHPAHKPRPLVGTRGRALPADDPHSAAFPSRPTPTRDRDDERYPDISRDDAHGWAAMDNLDRDGLFRRVPDIEAVVARELLGTYGGLTWLRERAIACDNAGCHFTSDDVNSVHYCPAYGPQ